jgi:dolichol-phosphate mannosyltransferase
MVDAETTIILPTLNEAGNIEPLIKKIKSTLQNAVVIVVDDQSTDGTLEIVKKLSLEDNSVQFISRTGKPCLTEAIQAGIDAAKTPFIGWMDADLSHPPEVLPILLREAKVHGCAIASRFISGGKQKSVKNSPSESVFATILSSLLNFIVDKWLNIPISDYTSGFIICRAKELKRHRLVGDYGEYFIELTHYFSKTGIKIKEVPFESPPRVWGESKTGTTLSKLLRRGLKYVWLAVRLKFSPKFKIQS